METLDPTSRPEAPRLLSSLSESTPWRQHVDGCLAAVMEAILLALVCGSSWLLGPSGTAPRLVVFAGLAVLLVLWGARVLLQGKVVWQKCPVTVCLGLLFLSGIWQLIALPLPIFDAVAPATARLYEQMLPAQPEVPPSGASASNIFWGATISLNPHATRTQAIELLAALLFFAIVRNNLPPAQGLRRLSLCVLANGALLVLVPFFLSSFQPKRGAGIGQEALVGSFLSREHYAFYLEMSLGLGAGLAFSQLRQNFSAFLPASQPPSIHGGSESGPSISVFRRQRCDLLTLLMAAGVTVLIAGLAYGLSPGGMVVMGGAIFTCFFLITFTSRRQLTRALGPLVGVAALTVWLKWDSFAAAGALWSRVLTFGREFPLWGTGLGTFTQVASNQGFLLDMDPSTLGSSPSLFMVMATEGGALLLVLSLLAIGLVLRLGYQAYHRHQNDPVGFIALGALLGFLALILHSCFAWGHQLPAVGLLVTVGCAYLCGLAGAHGANQIDLETRTQLVVPWGALTAPCGAVLLVVLGVILLGHGWQAYVVQSFAGAATALDTVEDRTAPVRRLHYLEKAVQLAPADAQLRDELAQAHVRVYKQKVAYLEKSRRILDAAQITNSLALGGSFESPLASVLAWHLALHWQGQLQTEKQDYLERQHLLPALKHWLIARRSSLLDPESQIHIAAHRHLLERADAQRAYLDRAMKIAPRDPWVYYQVGLLEMAAGQFEQAFNSWKQSLDLADAFLGPILERSRRQLAAQEILHRLLANRPLQMLLAADYLFPDTEATRQERAPFFQKVLQLQEETPNWQARDYHLAASAHAALGHITEGSEAFAKALAQEPKQIGWRYEFALFLYHQGKLQETQSELLTILKQQPGHQRARKFLATVRDRLAN